MSTPFLLKTSFMLTPHCSAPAMTKGCAPRSGTVDPSIEAPFINSAGSEQSSGAVTAVYRLPQAIGHSSIQFEPADRPAALSEIWDVLQSGDVLLSKAASPMSRA